MTQITAELVETFRWIEYAQLRGFVFSRDGVRLHGMINIQPDDVVTSFLTDWKRYTTSNPTISYSEDRDSKGNRTPISIAWGAFSDLTIEEAVEALTPHLGADEAVELLAAIRLQDTSTAVEVPVESL